MKASLMGCFFYVHKRHKDGDIYVTLSTGPYNIVQDLTFQERSVPNFQHKRTGIAPMGNVAVLGPVHGTKKEEQEGNLLAQVSFLMYLIDKQL
ncbi:hypothetical protein [Maribacter sp. 2307ULW6-5]|uniref:hypothetical protein n=1 Tax=Maribacter sp. 2307ULW6-5 TaxID=3386275 RepID=UPI0039BD262D